MTESTTVPVVEPTIPVHLNKEIDNSMRAKQLVASVRQGRRISIDVLDEGWLEGYLAGWDSETYFLLMPIYQNNSVEKYLIPKQNILAIQLKDDRTFREEGLHAEMEKIVKPFRDVLNSTYPR